MARQVVLRAASIAAGGDEAGSPLEAVETLVEGELGKLVDELIKDMAEWRSVTRRKGGQAMGVLARYAGDALGTQVGRVIEALCKLYRDDDDTVAPSAARLVVAPPKPQLMTPEPRATASAHSLTSRL